MAQLTPEQKELIKANLDKYFKSNNYDGFFTEVARGELYPYAHFFTDTVGRDMLRLMRDIPAGLYKNDPELRHVVIPGNINSIGEDAFKNCTNLVEVEIEDGVKSLGRNCFSGCTNLQTIKLPKTIDAIPLGCFRNCTSIKRIDVPENVKNFGAGSFSNCSDDLIITFPFKENAADRPKCKAQDIDFIKKHLKWLKPKAQPEAPKEV